MLKLRILTQQAPGIVDLVIKLLLSFPSAIKAGSIIIKYFLHLNGHSYIIFQKIMILVKKELRKDITFFKQVFTCSLGAIFIS